MRERPWMGLLGQGRWWPGQRMPRPECAYPRRVRGGSPRIEDRCMLASIPLFLLCMYVARLHDEVSDKFSKTVDVATIFFRITFLSSYYDGY